MSIKFIDFVPEQIRPPKLFSEASYSSLEECRIKMDEWVRKNDPEIIQIETVILPNIHNKREEGSDDVELKTYELDGHSNRWHQFFRLWYR